MNNTNITKHLTRDHKLILVVGKGGVGRTFLSDLTAKSLAEQGKRILLVRILDDSFSIDNAKHHTQKTSSHGYQEILLSPHEAFEEYVGIKLHMPRLAKFVLSNKAVQYLERSAPGVREITLLGKIWADRKNFDHVVVDMPSSGFALTMLGVPRNFARLFPVGPIYQDCIDMLKTFGDAKQTKFLLVSLPEELPIQESIEFTQELGKILPDNAPLWIINRIIEPDEKKLDQLSQWLTHAAKEKTSLLSVALSLRIHRAKNQNVALGNLMAARDKNPSLVKNAGIELVREQTPELKPGGSAERPADALEENLKQIKAQTMTNSPREVMNLLQTSKIIISCGLGGVGKTTSSAALGLAAAQMGRRVLVITIDPAKRLASALGLAHSDLKGQDLTAKVSAALQQEISGTFSALIPSTDQTFENFIRSVGKGQEKSVERILKTSIFKLFAQDFAGAHEYMAMEALHQVVTNENAPDLIILDTPPASNTRMFLDAPSALRHFFDESIGKWLGNKGGRLLSSGVQKLFEVMEKVTGKGFISELVEFTASLFELRSQFLSNLEEVGKILRGKDVNFLMVCTAERISKEDTKRFLEELREKEFPFWGFLVNRTLIKHMKSGGTVGADKNLEASFPQEMLPHLRLIKYRITQEIDTLSILLDLKKKQPHQIACFPEINEEIHSIQALHALAKEIIHE